MSSSSIEEQLTRHIVQEILAEEDGFSLGPDEPLLTGILDSFGLMSLVTFLEEQFDLDIDVAEVTTEHFATVRSLSAFVESSLNRAASV